MPTRSIPWPRILAEGFAIVVSILLAFGIQAWWEESQERAEEQSILAGLEADFRANLDQLQRLVRQHEDYGRRLEAFERMTPSQAAGLSQDSVRLVTSAFGISGTFDSRDATLEAVIASGRLNVIRDTELRDRLVEWRGMVEDSREEAEDVRDASERVNIRIASLGGPWASQPTGRTAQFPSLVEALARSPEADPAVIRGDEELMALGRFKRRRSIVYLMEIMTLASTAEAVLARLGEAEQ